ncbi:PREDICTED: MND1-interacting protein 1-like [Prunus mume]|uniref:MND1-interacting protein 1-like n=1 Tax=Prunus mume TaxID=102107 RepID=A0ABM0PE23_PRUMU|nr:PREDICTED: MND1-interacting protein 1-like [Prunus mume]
MQAATKLSHDLAELKMLRLEREETQRLKKGKQTLEDSTMKRLSDMENALRKASGQVDRANAAVRRLETENAEIRAEMEASKLSASESVLTCLEVAKREKKCLKRMLAWEKQKIKLQEEIAEEKEKISELQRHLARMKHDQKEAEVKWGQELKAKEEALAQVEEEQRAKEAAEASNKRKVEALRLKIEIDFQRHKDDLQRLEQELSRLKISAQSTELLHPSNALPKAISEGAKPQGETIAKLLRELDNLENSSEKEVNCDRECIICMKDEVSVVFLPCAHQVLCANCNDDYGKKGKATCPCCRAPIEHRIRVFGASS